MRMYLTKCQVDNMHMLMKRGVKVGTQIATVDSFNDWFHVCTLYQSDCKNMKQSTFLKSAVSVNIFSKTKS